MSTVLKRSISGLRPDSAWSKKGTLRKGSTGSAPGAPFSYWKLDSLGATTPDSVGGRDLTVVGSPTSVSGKISNAVQNVPTSGYLRSTDAAFGFGDTDFTWRFWLMQPAVGTAGLIQKKDGSTPFDGYKFQTDTTNGPQLYCENGTGAFVVNSGVILSNGVWNMIVGYHDAANNLIGISVNNSAFVTLGYTVGTGFPSTDLVTSTNGDCVLDEIGIWTGKVFSQAEVDYEWNGGAGRTY